jgi:hypothetical protein
MKIKFASIFMVLLALLPLGAFARGRQGAHPSSPVVRHTPSPRAHAPRVYVHVPRAYVPPPYIHRRWVEGRYALGMDEWCM